jgi:hypothetical protein
MKMSKHGKHSSGVRENRSPRVVRALIAVATLSWSAGCSKGPAEAALKRADQAIEAARPDGEIYAPEQFKTLTDAAKKAHDAFDRGDLATATSAAHDIGVRVQEVMEAAAIKRDASVKEWADAQENLGKTIEAIKEKITELAAGKSSGMDASKLASAQSRFRALEETWGNARKAARTRNFVEAAEKAKQARTDAEELMRTLGLTAQVPSGASTKR